MNIKASGRSALILAAGLWIGFAGPSQAAAGDATATSKQDSAAAASATPDNSAKHGSRHLKKYAHRKSDKVADKPAADTKATAANGGDNSPTVQSTQMSPSVANANAQLTPTDTLAGNVKAMSDRVSNILQGAPDNAADAQSAVGTPIIAADQLNDVDRALHENTPVALASADAPVGAASSPVASAGSDNSTWDQTSLIGKIFIGFGALLTMASAARMFMA